MTPFWQTIRNNFNSYFTNIGPNLANKSQNVNPINPLSYLNTLDNNVFHFQDIDESIVEQIIDNFPSKKQLWLRWHFFKVIKIL